ncbi:MAG TPA: cytochrome c [Anaeromyxobacteraceae bacterium]|nr:cytochrome c [Anaeromyxobacteraceae bacterium]
MKMPKKHTALAWLGLAGLGAALAACGAAETSGSGVTGVALANGPVSGTVSLIDSSAQAQTRQVSTRADGSFSVDVDGLTPPYLLQVSGTTAAGSTQLYAVTPGNENLDVNPLTDMAFASAVGTSDPSAVFSTADASTKKLAAGKARALLDQLTTVLAPLFQLYGITDVQLDRTAVRTLLADVTVSNVNGLVTVANAATGAIIYEGPLSDLASGTFYEANMPAGPGSTPSACTSFTYSAWDACQADGTQSRTVTSASPTGCTGGTPVTTQSCTYVPPVTTCSAFTYSAWGTCQSNDTQTRAVTSASPAGCTGGTPVTTQSCTYVAPIDGAALYTQYCAGCHGTSKKGSTATAIQSAIDSNRGGMGSLKFLTPEQVAAIAASK